MKLNPTQIAHIRSRAKGSASLDHLRIRHAANGGHVVEHHFVPAPMGYQEPKQHVFAKHEGKKMMAHLARHMKIAEPMESKQEEAGESAGQERREMRMGKS